MKKILVLLAAIVANGCGDAIPTAPVPPPALTLYLSDYPSADLALRAAELYGSVLDMDSCRVAAKCVVALQVHGSPFLLNQSRYVTIQNCGWGGLNNAGTAPVLSAAPGVSVYFFTLNNCLINSGRVDYTNFYNSTFSNIWSPQGALTATGPAYYNQFINVYSGGACLTALATAGPSTGPNHNQIIGGRCQGTVLIGKNVQDWDISGMAFEGCGRICLDVYGTRVHIGFNRFECGAGVNAGILLERDSDGWIDPQYWSSCINRIAFATFDDALHWAIAIQPEQQ